MAAGVRRADAGVGVTDKPEHEEAKSIIIVASCCIGERISPIARPDFSRTAFPKTADIGSYKS